MDKFVSKIKFRRDVTANLANVVLDLGEPALAIDTGILKIGDGVKTFEQLPAISATHIIEEPLADGEYLRKKEGTEYTWILKDARKDLKDLLTEDYHTEVYMGYTIKDKSGIDKKVYGMRKFFLSSADPIYIGGVPRNTEYVVELAGNVQDLLEINGTTTDGHGNKVTICCTFNHDLNDILSSAAYIDDANKLKFESTCTADRTNVITDVYFLYTKVVE